MALLARHLKRAGYDLVLNRVDTAEAMKAALESREWDVILCDYSMPQFNALAALALTKEVKSDTPFIIISGTIGEAAAVEGMRAGAHDYMMKDRLTRLIPAIEREMNEAENRRARRAAEEALLTSERKYRLLFDSNPLPIWVFDRETLRFLAVNEAAVVHYGLELTGTNKVSQATFQAALDQLGVQGLTEFTMSMGYFRLLALNANACTIDLPDQRTEPLLPI